MVADKNVVASGGMMRSGSMCYFPPRHLFISDKLQFTYIPFSFNVLK
jgi:hypothetical protein